MSPLPWSVTIETFDTHSGEETLTFLTDAEGGDILNSCSKDDLNYIVATQKRVKELEEGIKAALDITRGRAVGKLPLLNNVEEHLKSLL